MKYADDVCDEANAAIDVKWKRRGYVKKKVITTHVTHPPVKAPTTSSDKLCALFR